MRTGVFIATILASGTVLHYADNTARAAVVIMIVAPSMMLTFVTVIEPIISDINEWLKKRK